MKIIVLGAGAIGSLYGAKLSKLYDVTLVVRQKHADEINKNGLKITGLENNTYKLKAITKIKKIEDNTLILLTTKVYDSKKAVWGIRNLIKKDTIILCLQNGLCSENIVKEVVGDKCLVLRGISNIGAAFLKPGTIQYNTTSYTAIEKSILSKDLVNEIKKYGLDSYVSENIKQDEWKKLIINCLINPLSVILRKKNNAIADENLNPLKKMIADECLKVAERDGIKFDIDFVKMVNKMIKDSKNISSMQQDILKGKKTEIDYLNGAVVELGRKYKIKCPVNEGLVMIIKRMEK
jgi:2-dehydropantoate 2-reductase|tara:strand:+ start:79578 stop:80456 length:879 start_codon:yes stop_codon:yes gene_type:complete